jgi:hypothetical protein
LADQLERIAREHDLVASMHETADELASLFAESIEQRRSSLPPATSAAAAASATRLPAPAPVPRLAQAALEAPSTAAATATATATAAATATASAADGETDLDAELARLPLRRSPWLSIAIAASAIAVVVTALVIADYSGAAPSLQAEPATRQARPRAPRPGASDRRDRAPSASAVTSTPAPTRHLGFAPTRVPDLTADGAGSQQGASERARPHHDDGPVELEPNPYLQR